MKELDHMKADILLVDDLLHHRQNDSTKSHNFPQESILFDGIKWNVFLSEENPPIESTGSDFYQAVLVQKGIREASNPAKMHNGLSQEHLETMLFIVNRWNFIVPKLRIKSQN